MRHLGEKKLRERLPLIYELAEEYMGIDPAHECIPVRPGIHYTMGGIYADLKTATPLPGLYAAGECASNGIHGANRLGSNSLVDMVVFGKMAGIEAAQFAKIGAEQQCRRYWRSRPRPPKSGRWVWSPRLAAGKALRSAQGDGKSMESGCGIYRTAPEMQATCDKIGELRARYKNLQR